MLDCSEVCKLWLFGLLSLQAVLVQHIKLDVSQQVDEKSIPQIDFHLHGFVYVFTGHTLLMLIIIFMSTNSKPRKNNLKSQETIGQKKRKKKCQRNWDKFNRTKE